MTNGEPLPGEDGAAIDNAPVDVDPALAEIKRRQLAAVADIHPKRPIYPTAGLLRQLGCLVEPDEDGPVPDSRAVKVLCEEFREMCQ